MVAAMLRVGGMKRVGAAITRLLSRHPASPEPTDVKDAARLVSIAARRGPWRSQCLTTALTLQWLLARRGIATDLRLGVRRKDGRMEAHAWVEYEGMALIETAGVHERFGAFDPIPR
jgi:hypothetical protein